MLLSVEEVKLWIDHLQKVSENRKKGAAKSSGTGDKNRKNFLETEKEPEKEQCFCGVCGHLYVEETYKVEDWIECETCLEWIHWSCVGLEKEPPIFKCTKCEGH